MQENKKNTEKTSPETYKGNINKVKSDSKELNKSSQGKITQKTPNKEYREKY